MMIANQARTCTLPVMIFVLGLALLAASCQRSSETDPPTLTGIISDADGQPLPGVLVRIQGEASGLSLLTNSQSNGHYATPALLPDSYLVQAFGDRFQSEVSGPVTVAVGHRSTYDLSLIAPRSVYPEPEPMELSDYFPLMPEGEGRQLVSTRCVLCHHLDRVVPTRHDRATWAKSVDRMRSFFNSRSDLQREFHLPPISETERDVMLQYLSANFHADVSPMPANNPETSPLQHLPGGFAAEGGENFVVVEFTPPGGMIENEIGIDKEGNAWITEGDTDRFGRFDPASLTYTRLTAPPGKFPRVLSQISIDPAGDVWILDNGPTPDAILLRYNPATEDFREYELKAPPGLRAPVNTILFLDGFVWGTGNASSRVIRLDPDTGEIAEYPAPLGSHPYGIAIGSDGAIWYTGNYDNAIVRIDPDSGETSTFKARRGSGIRRMDGDAAGNMWVGAQDSNQLIKLDIRTGEITTYEVPTENSGPYAVDIDTTRNLVWFTERDGDRIGRFNPETETFVEFPLVRAGTEPRRIYVDPVNPNRVWWGCSKGGFGYVEVF
jgi:streptogramin lyase